MKTTKLARPAFAITLAIVIANLSFARPAQASDHVGCMHHHATPQSLQACVTHAREMGHIDNHGIVRSMHAKLDAAQAALLRGQVNVAAAQLNAFIHEVQAQSGKHIDAMHAEHMVMHARHVIDALP